MDRVGYTRAVLELGRAAAEGDTFVAEALEVLDRHVGADGLVFSRVHVQRGTGSPTSVLRHMEPFSAAEVAEWHRLLPSHPYSQWHLTAPLGTSRVTDVVDLRTLERTEIYRTLMAPRGQRFQAGLLFGQDDGNVTLLSLWRATRDFNDHEIETLEVARSVLVAGLEQYAARERARLWASPSLLWSPLTRRQAQVAALVARGLTNEQIAHQLDIAPRTVRKHLEDVFAATGCRNRTAVALWWHEGGRRAT
jgi:DNA-binding CsgD family transcriptional regulator